MQTKNTDTSKQRRSRGWISCSDIFLATPFLALLLYFSFCWGLWGRHNRLLQYLFQCSCPDISTEARYPEEVDVIIPACRYMSSMLTPSGRMLYVEEKIDNSNSTYLLDLQTQEKIPFFIPEGSPHFLTDDLLFLWVDCGKEYECGYFIMDRSTGKQFPIRTFVNLRPDAFTYNLVDVEILADYLREAEDVFLIDDDFIVALAPDFRASPDHNFYVVRGAFEGYDSDRAEQFLRTNNINFIYVPDILPGEALSPDGRFIAREDGIYLAKTNQKIVEGYSSSRVYRSYSGKYYSVRGWTYDSTGVIYSKFLNPCLVEVSIVEVGCLFVSVPQPLIKLKIPEEYRLTGLP